MHKEPKKVLIYFNGGCVPGGIRNFAMNLYRNIDRNKIQFHFLVFTENKNFYLKELEELGGKAILITDKAVSKVSLYGNIKLAYLTYKVLKSDSSYTAIHCNSTSIVGNEGFYLMVAKLCGVKVRISHSHFGYLDQKWNIKARLFGWLSGTLINLFATHKIGCSKIACEALYGDKCFHDSRTRVIYNGINFNRFNKEKYEFQKMCDKYNVDRNKINFINIGRFTTQKNQLFLLELFSELRKLRDDIHLNIVGYGELETDIKTRIEQLNLNNEVTLFKANTNIPELLSTMNYFLLPSIHEGFPIVLLEAQAMGIKCLVSDTVTSEIDFGLCDFISLNNTKSQWIQSIINELEFRDSIPQKLDDSFRECDETYMAQMFTEIYMS